MKIENQNQFYRVNLLEQKKINEIMQKLRRIEQKVIAHEMAHKSVAGRYAGAVHYTYTKGPDGRLYITGGEVSLDLTEEATPEETAKKMEIIEASALAPADPSPQDIRVAQMAVIKRMKAEVEASRKRQEEKSTGLIIRRVV